MPRREVAKRRRFKIATGDMNECVQIFRTVTVPRPGGKSEKRFELLDEAWMKIDTISSLSVAGGARLFNGRNTKETPTHRFSTRADPALAAENFLSHDGCRYEILDVEVKDERGEYVVVTTKLTGSETKEAASA